MDITVTNSFLPVYNNNLLLSWFMTKNLFTTTNNYTMYTNEECLTLTDLIIRLRNLQTKFVEYGDRHILNECKRLEKILDNYVIDLIIKYNIQISKPVPSQNKLW